MKKLVVVLACSIILATAIPIAASAASNAAKFDTLKLSDVKTYDTALPAKGTKKTLVQMEALWKLLPYKPAGKGSTTYRASLNFSKDLTASNKNYNYASKTKVWHKEIGNSKFFHYYSEDTSIIRSEGTSCFLSTEDSKYYYYYFWKKGSKEGCFSKYKRPNNDTPPPADTAIYRVYPDETVLGDKCFVYSWESEEDASVSYVWISRKNGVMIKDVGVSEGYISTSVYFVTQKEEKKDSFFTPPKLKWNESKGSISENRSGMYQPRF